MLSRGVRVASSNSMQMRIPHINIRFTAELSRRFKDDGMLAYVQLVQQKERDLGVDILTHQKWCVHEMHLGFFAPLRFAQQLRWYCSLTDRTIVHIYAGVERTMSTGSSKS